MKNPLNFGGNHAYSIEQQKRGWETRMKDAESDKELTTFQDQVALDRQEALDTFASKELERLKEKDAHNLANQSVLVAEKIKEFTAKAEADSKLMDSVQSGFIEALTSVAQSGSLEALAEHIAPLSIVEGQSIGAILNKMFGGTKFEGLIQSMTNRQRTQD